MSRPATCHPDKPMLARGLCAPCYQRQWAEANPDRLKATRERRKAAGVRATCHPDRPVLARGLCSTCYRREWRKDPTNKEREKDWQRTYNRKRYPAQSRKLILRKYRLTPDDFDRMLAEQGGTCATCPSTERLQVDHCHTSGEVRAILCANCNSTLGHAKDDPTRLRALADYVERYSADASGGKEVPAAWSCTE